MNLSSFRKLFFSIAFIFTLAILYGLWLAFRPVPIVLQGRMDMLHTDIAAKVPGRIDEIFVKEGMDIQKGNTLLTMDSPEIRAKIAQANAAQEAAHALVQKAQQGARPQEVEMAYATWQRAAAAAKLSATTYQRVKSLAEEGLIAQQKLDEARTLYLADQQQAAAALAQYQMVQEGARREDQQAAIAESKRMDAIVAEAQVALDETHLAAPVSGQVAEVLVNPGEVVGQGVPLVTIVNHQDQWVVLNIREDLLADFPIGKRFNATIPALGEAGKAVDFTVFASKVLPDFATWRATRSQESFDRRTFEVKARPDAPIANIRQGMSVLVTLPKTQS